MSKEKTPAQMDIIREAESRIQEKLRAELVPEKNEARPVAYFQVDRYFKGNFTGMFVLSQLITEDRDGKPLNKPLRKVLADGVGIEVVTGNLETALRRKVFK